MTEQTGVRIQSFRDDALGSLDATGLAEEIRAGRVSAVEAVRAAVQRIAAVDPTLNAMQIQDFDRAFATAASAAGVFAGVPTVIKDNTDVAGLPTNHGSSAVNAARAQSSSPFTRQFLSTGVVSLGKSTMPEFGFNATTEYADRPPTRNPWNTDFSCGASSGGSAALVASGAVPIAHGNDGGGSIRIPASACGLVGLKPTRGREELAADAAHMPVNIISNGILSRTVRDTANYLAAIERYRRAPALAPVGLVAGPSTRRLRVGVVHDSITRSADPETREAVTRTADLLGALGHQVAEIPIPLLGTVTRFEDDFLHYWTMLGFSVQRFGKAVYGRQFDASRTDNLTQGLARTFAHRFWRTPGVIMRLRRTESEYASAFADIDVIVGPVMGTLTPRIGHLDPALDFDTLLPRLLQVASFTPLNNATGSPAMSLPMATSASGMPIGIHFAASHGDERTLLELAFEIEGAQPFARIDN